MRPFSFEIKFSVSRNQVKKFLWARTAAKRNEKNVLTKCSGFDSHFMLCSCVYVCVKRSVSIECVQRMLLMHLELFGCCDDLYTSKQNKKLLNKMEYFLSFNQINSVYNSRYTFALHLTRIWRNISHTHVRTEKYASHSFRLTQLKMFLSHSNCPTNWTNNKNCHIISTHRTNGNG